MVKVDLFIYYSRKNEATDASKPLNDASDPPEDLDREYLYLKYKKKL